MPNPYESPQTTTPAVGRNWRVRGKHLAAFFFLAYPVLLVASLYACWLLAWLALGHPPRPSLDDPGNIHPAVRVFYYIPGLMMVCFPMGMFGGISILARASGRFWLGLGLIGLWLAAFVLLRWDPLEVTQWYMD